MKYFVTQHPCGRFLLNKMHHCDNSKGISMRWESISDHPTLSSAMQAGNAKKDIEGECEDLVEAFASCEAMKGNIKQEAN
jgi:hypothetical protein